ncbi:hypothetical protein CGLO_16745 [Colletotrichum gloeosporioides Cg-14]|uniref:Uncharacterized protein n=1 Tax=Colletotrichum gloeosporioides (strain Cg-14) TaxID=1237896 RepID=T0KYV3_COLGC|nr:hypothetical protein CGLO_16745 [Colletotrichum gloeosporioides Cg-14]
MALTTRRKIEANADVSYYLTQIRMAHDIHASQQIGPDGIPGLWTTLHRNHYAHAWRIHVAQSQQPGWLPPTATSTDDPRDFVAFLRAQLRHDELAFALFVVFQAQRTRMRDNVGVEVKRRYNALKGNVGSFTEDDLMFELGLQVLTSTPSLRLLNSLLNPRNDASIRIQPAVLFQAIRQEMLQRHQDATTPPSPIPADVTKAADRLRPQRLSSSNTPTPAPPAALAPHIPQAQAQAAQAPEVQLETDGEPQDQAEPKLETDPEPQVEAQAQVPVPAQAPEDGPGEEGEEQQELGWLPPPSSPDDSSLHHQRGRKRQTSPNPLPASKRLRHDQAEEDEEETPETGRDAPEAAPSLSLGDELDIPSPRQDAPRPSIPNFTPLADTPPPQTPSRRQPAQPNASSSPTDFQTPPQAPLAIPSEARPVLSDELERWCEIVRLAENMPAPQGSRLWVESVRTAVQALRTVGIWADEMLDEEALRDDTL